MQQHTTTEGLHATTPTLARNWWRQRHGQKSALCPFSFYLEIRQAVLPLRVERLLGLEELLLDGLTPERLHRLRFALKLSHLRR